MENIYLLIAIILVGLAVSDLIVGVSNDAVNFLNSAIGSKVAPLRVILIVAAAGVLVGATFSSGMMEVARKGIFYPGEFSFHNIMIIFLAVMLTDIILLDLFNTFGLPTSTTVSIVFELLGAAVGMAVIRISNDTSQNISDLANYINSAKALAIISGILVSVVIAFSVGAIVQYISRLIFTFNYAKVLKWFGSIWGGFAISSITYFILIKGAKGASWMTAETVEWIKSNTFLILSMAFIISVVILQILIWVFKINILKLIVLVGTFALAMAFAGNDLVNFIGVPLAGISSYTEFSQIQGADVHEFMMSVLAEKVKTPTYFLLIAGLVMVLTLWFSKKSRSVVKTSLNLSDQDQTEERFESSGIARKIVRTSTQFTTFLKTKLPDSFVQKVRERFDDEQFRTVTKVEEGVNFDLVRASVNLIVASILIAIGTSLKLPLSTTYVTFMVAMGTSLADGAWDRESAVFRITGVITVIGGWFFTALSAFTAALLVSIFLAKLFPYSIFIFLVIVLIIVYRTHIIHKKKEQKEEIKKLSEEHTKFETIDDVIGKCSNSAIDYLEVCYKSYQEVIEAFLKDKRKTIKALLNNINELNTETKEAKLSLPAKIKSFDESLIEIVPYYVEITESVRESVKSTHFIIEPMYKHIDNSHKPFSKVQEEMLNEIKIALFNYGTFINKSISSYDFSTRDKQRDLTDDILDLISQLRKRQLKTIKKENSNTRVNILFLEILNETKNLVLNFNTTYKTFAEMVK